MRVRWGRASQSSWRRGGSVVCYVHIHHLSVLDSMQVIHSFIHSSIAFHSDIDISPSSTRLGHHSLCAPVLNGKILLLFPPPPSRHTTPSFPIPAERLPLTSYPQAGLLSTAAATAALPLFFSAPDAAFDPGRDAPRPGETPPVMRVSQGQALRLARSFQSSMRRTVGRRESARSVVRQGLLCLLLPLCLLCSPCSLLSLRSTHGKSPSRLVPRPTLPRVAARGGTRRY